jgi:hypothetical protein
MPVRSRARSPRLTPDALVPPRALEPAVVVERERPHEAPGPLHGDRADEPERRPLSNTVIAAELDAGSRLKRLERERVLAARQRAAPETGRAVGAAQLRLQPVASSSRSARRCERARCCR